MGRIRIFSVCVLILFCSTLGSAFDLHGTGAVGGGSGLEVSLFPGLRSEEYAEHEVLVRFKVSTVQVVPSLEEKGMRVVKEFRTLSKRLGGAILLLRSDTLTAREMVSLLRKHPGVGAVSYNYRRHLLSTVPNDPFLGELWGLNNTGQSGGTVDADVDAPEAWDVSVGSSGVVVAVVDTGVDYTHEDLVANMWQNFKECNGNPGVDDDGNGYVDDCYGYDFAGDNQGNNDPDPRPDLFYGVYGHGTHVAGIIGAVGNNSTGVAGVNWQVKVMALKMFRPDLSGYDSDAIEAINYAVLMKDRGVNIVAINASWGGGGYDQLLEDAIKAAGEAGILFVAAAGNEYRDDDNTPLYPCSYDLSTLVCVGATDHNDEKPDWSNFGYGSVDLGAPGASILSTFPGGGYHPGAGDIFFDDMEHGSEKWATGGENCSWAITDEESHSTSHSWSDSPSGEYQNGTDSWLAVNDDIDLSIHKDENVILGFWVRYDVECCYDYLLVEFSKDSGVTWREVGRVTGTNSEFGLVTSPVPYEFRTSHFRFRFRLVTDSSVTKDGVYIDDVGVGVGEASNSYEKWSGTSMATPHVTGAVALMAAQYPGEGVCQRVGRVFSGVEVKPQLGEYWWSGGRLNLFNSITAATLAPVISAITPTQGMGPGTQFTITGCGFGDTPGEVVFTTGSADVRATVLSWSDTSITALVPAGTGKFVRVMRNDGVESNPEKVSEWHTVHHAGTPRSDAAAVVYHGKVYLFGGYTNGSPRGTGTCEVYDPATDSWSYCSSMPTARALLTGAEVGGIVYVIGGYDDGTGTFFDTVEAYDPSSDTWETKASLPVAMVWMRAVSLDGKIFVTGGLDKDGEALNTLYEYDPQTNTWTQRVSMNQARYGHGVAALNGKIYVFGGTDGSGYLDSAEVYDPATDTWTPIASLSLAFARMGAATDGCKVYLVGGTTGSWWYDYLPVYVEYDPLTDAYHYERRSIKELITPKSAAPLVYVAEVNALFTMGGLGSGALSLDEVERLSGVRKSSMPDFNVNCRTDTTVWRPSNGHWYGRDHKTKDRFDRTWGNHGDIPFVGDFDGDGKTDVGVWRDTNGRWYVLLSSKSHSTSQPLQTTWGQDGDIPAPGDYDGDGKTDYGVWRPSNGKWYIKSPDGAIITMTTWGQDGDIPVPGDYNGDGKTDFGIWRPSNGKWYIKSPDGTIITMTTWGQDGDVPVPADFDGDGKTDFGIWRPSNGKWYIKSPNGSIIKITTWGSGSYDDIPIAGDYDADGKADITIWRPSNGHWYIKTSSSDFTERIDTTWGTGSYNDLPMGCSPFSAVQKYLEDINYYP